jgi:hypothetical protein
MRLTCKVGICSIANVEFWQCLVGDSVIWRLVIGDLTMWTWQPTKMELPKW